MSLKGRIPLAIACAFLTMTPLALANNPSGSATFSCTGYSISLGADIPGGLIPGQTYTIAYPTNLVSPVPPGFSLSGTYSFVASGPVFSTTITGSFTPALTGSYTFTGGILSLYLGPDTTGQILQNVAFTVSPMSMTCSAPPPPPACTIPSIDSAIPGNAVSWNGFNAPAGSVVWINAHINGAQNVPANTITTVDFTGVTVVVNATSYAIPNGHIVFSPGTTTPTTVVNGDGSWTTTVAPNSTGDIFFDGQAIPVDANLENGGHGNTGSTFSFTTSSSDSNLSFSWQWSAAVYTSWPGNALANIEPVHGKYQAGAPQNTAVQADLIQGPRGGGGSNFTGSWSGTGTGTCPQ
jgi:hypothetical protein